MHGIDLERALGGAPFEDVVMPLPLGQSQSQLDLPDRVFRQVSGKF